MKSYSLLILINLISLMLTAQPAQYDANEQKTAEAAVAFEAEDWTVLHPDGSIEFSDETARLITDSAYRAAFYGIGYQLRDVSALLQKQKVMQSLWVLINLYPEEQDQVKHISQKLALRGIRGQHYLSAFYTYTFADPEVFQFNGLQPELMYPDRMEEKLQSCKALAALNDAVFAEIQKLKKSER